MVHRIGLLYSSDGVKAFTHRAKSYTPSEFIVLSLPPRERYKPQNMIIHMMYETGLKASHLAKYYDFAVQHELSTLYTKGLRDTQIKWVVCFWCNTCWLTSFVILQVGVRLCVYYGSEREDGVHEHAIWVELLRLLRMHSSLQDWTRKKVCFHGCTAIFTGVQFSQKFRHSPQT